MYDVTILGSGPAGLTAAIYTGRADLRTLVVEGLSVGGQLMITTTVENFPGFPEGVEGPELMDRIRKQAEKFGAEFKLGDAEEIKLDEHPFKVKVSNEWHETRSVIVATGSSSRWLGLESEKKLMGRGVSGCATCDGFFFMGKDVAVIGGGDSAIEDATFLTRFAKKVTIIHRRDQLRASKAMQKKAFKDPKIEFIWDSVVEDILDVNENKVTGIVLKNVKTDEKTTFPVDGVFIAIGHEPATSIFKGKLELDDHGYIVTEGVKTSVPGVFAAGDVQDPRYRQAISAAGTGCMAGIEVLKYIEGEQATGGW
ncbi:MAG: thioredoxin-disulfide reductase [Candidatus Latescibacteria bacterium 4484_7]|nr:MAG: thioredoxin-disulfide reductase [Candidatus Latescibacteria bacterium 4484_7]